MTEGSVTRAANALCMTQPAVSNAGAAARQPGRPAVRARAGNGVIPTQRAAVLWSELGEALDRMRGALDAEAFDPARATMEFSLSMSDYIAGIVLPPLFGRLSSRAAGARAPCPTRCWKSRNSWKRTAPTACSAPTSTKPSTRHIRSRSLWLVEYACFMRHDHPLAGMKRLSTRAFVGAPRGREPGRPDAAVLRHVPVGAACRATWPRWSTTTTWPMKCCATPT